MRSIRILCATEGCKGKIIVPAGKRGRKPKFCAKCAKKMSARKSLDGRTLRSLRIAVRKLARDVAKIERRLDGKEQAGASSAPAQA